MDKQVQKLKKLIDNFLYSSKENILKEWGDPLKHSDNEIWFYNKYRWGIFKDEIGFIFEEDFVADITITQFIFWNEYQNIFYYEGQIPEYRIMKSQLKFN